MTVVMTEVNYLDYLDLLLFFDDLRELEKAVIEVVCVDRL